MQYKNRQNTKSHKETVRQSVSKSVGQSAGQTKWKVADVQSHIKTGRQHDSQIGKN